MQVFVLSKEGAFIIKDCTSDKRLLEVTSRKLERVARPVQGFLITRQAADVE